MCVLDVILARDNAFKPVTSKATPKVDPTLPDHISDHTCSHAGSPSFEFALYAPLHLHSHYLDPSLHFIHISFHAPSLFTSSTASFIAYSHIAPVTTVIIFTVFSSLLAPPCSSSHHLLLHFISLFSHDLSSIIFPPLAPTLQFSLSSTSSRPFFPKSQMRHLHNTAPSVFPSYSPISSSSYFIAYTVY
ncbi:hypothetical protein EGR_01973 [Echinococcus granulosus]|uniref:Uncharacterized protein n=1 Tax=Echinococcus granulosus TaxID=6210 RepID=W6V9B1_ECHGR|nr:hypothetical protein EGR_01973 [Echinococcus granulosus]EUB63169.1 hypothetical protein EGR_01973 [Echinococcus granulosus]